MQCGNETSTARRSLSRTLDTSLIAYSTLLSNHLNWVQSCELYRSIYIATELQTDVNLNKLETNPRMRSRFTSLRGLGGIVGPRRALHILRGRSPRDGLC